ncbi:MAG: DUF1653 domain-containing protein [Proteobacteria bacterium]|nr:DUF1653 domain-containing protein [Pseudomonadota bacterium]
MSNGHLFQTGWYLSNNGVSHHVVGLAQHSETGAFYLLDATDPSDWHVLELTRFADQNANGKGPAYTLVQKTDGKVYFVTPAIEPGTYRHFKGKTYDIYGTLRDENGQTLVLYRPTYGQRALLLRPLAMFTEEVDRPEIPYKGPRFWLMGTRP